MIINSVLAALVAKFDAATTVPIFDGPDISALNKQATGFVLVGSSGDEDEDAVVIDQALSNLGPGTWLEETGDIVCAAISWAGGKDIATRRAASLAVATACADAVQDDPTLNGVLIEPGRADVSALRLQQRAEETGVLVRVVFTVRYSALVT